LDQKKTWFMVIGNLDLMEMEHILLALKLKPLKLCKIMDPSICTVLLSKQENHQIQPQEKENFQKNGPCTSPE